MSPRFSIDRIASFCRGPAQAIALQAVAETGSTNADLLAAVGAPQALMQPTLLLAERQTAGRGRAGRPWLSAPGDSLTFSLAWRFRRPMHALGGLPLAVGVAIAEALAMFEVQVQLKWPNDVLLQGRKLAGILIETAQLPPQASGQEQGCWAVVGIGINLAVSPGLAAEIGRPVASIPWLAELDQDLLVATLLNALAETLAQFEQHGFAAFRQRWAGLQAYAGQPVKILDNGRLVHEGIAAGVDDGGRYLLDTAGGRIAVMAGDVSLRAQEE